MKRKIAAIFAADIAGYSRLVAEDEEETLRRLASYREVVDDFIASKGTADRPCADCAAVDSFRRFKNFATTTTHRADGARLLCMGLFSQF
ncbi:hypothetical protein [Bradyrhizobium cajani]|uniref:Guanylate cyclase domain-containing protein n=1 Tax=Bradyrhizobium cajani TaxID=1928661 RepID=A0A844TID4_9BRAD|nr:hypothetical protein [Bradyrhizobium cajani]MCP3373310.1 hypothetical protein [Bradyrhizobium cajani]MVT74771.1 hypothetical protein [Bradyrhizobium cajani]